MRISGLSVRFLCLISVLLRFSAAQSIRPNIEHITTINGLSHNTIRTLLQDKTGFMWAATLNGLDRYDGVNVKSFRPEPGNPLSLSNAKVKDLYEDKSGYIWVRTFNDIYHCYCPKIDQFVAFSSKKDNLKRTYSALSEGRDGRVWLYGKNGCLSVKISDGKAVSTAYGIRQEVSLPSDDVRDILTDSRGNSWILTAKGIVLVSDKGVVSYPRKGNKRASFIRVAELNNQVFCIEKTGLIVGYDLATKQFSETNSPPLLNVGDVCKMGNKGLIIISNPGQMLFFDPASKSVSPAQTVLGEQPEGRVSVKTDPSGNLLFYNATGWVSIFHLKTGKSFRLNLIPASVLHFIDEERYQFLTDCRGLIWITTYGNGLFCLDPATGELTHFGYEKNNTNSLSGNYLLSLTEDKSGNIWVGSESKGLNNLSFPNRQVKTYFPDPQTTEGNNNLVKAFLEDKNKNIWVATKAGSLYIYDRSFEKQKVVFQNGYNVYCLMQDSRGDVWAGTKGSGLLFFAQGDYTRKPVVVSVQSATGPQGSNHIYSILEDSRKRIWAASFGGGIQLLTPNGFRSFAQIKEWNKHVRHLMQDKSGQIWAATNNGVIRFNPDALLKDNRQYKCDLFDLENKNSLSAPEVRFVFQDKSGTIWLAMAGGGLNRFDGETADGKGKYRAFTTAQGLANDNPVSLLQDNQGLLWIATESGLSKFNTQTGIFRNYSLSDQLAGNIYSEAASLKLKDGRLMWGTLDGFNVFAPDALSAKSSNDNRVVLTSLSIFDEPARVAEEDAPLKTAISFANRIDLQAHDNVFHIGFASLNFKNGGSDQYLYILENFEKRWNASGSYNVATYRNVPPGEYTFRVKSIDADGHNPQEVTSVRIVVHPPFWLTWYAFVLYFLLLIGIIYVAFRLISKFNRLNQAVQVEHQLTEYKLRFFTNISHEFRTPLALIKGSVDSLNELIERLPQPIRPIIRGLDKNTTHLMRLIDQLLEFRKLQNNKQKLNLQRVEVIAFLRDIHESFGEVARKTNIDYRFLCSPEELFIYIDRNKLDKIVFNLLSNAFKFTPRGGKITLSAFIDQTQNWLSISVADNGIGIPKEKQALLFSRFMQINFSASGTGIGLSLVNEFSLLHKGRASFVENELGGSVFTVDIPLSEKVYSPDEFVVDRIVKPKHEESSLHLLSEFIEDSESSFDWNVIPVSPADTKYKILVIDDNLDIRDFLQEKLEPYFQIITAEDGIAGIKRGEEEDPDLIICDVMMPGMNGFELTSKLKSNFETCHIPIILLTAYMSDEHNTEGVQSGADAYISKPFSLKHLMLQINKLLEKREAVQRHYSVAPEKETAQQATEENETMLIPDIDKLFIQKVEKILDERLSDADFSVDEFAQLAGTGRTLFFKKIKNLTGYSPNEFIRVRRMNLAAKLLISKQLNVSEVSYKVGINDPFYFSKCFKAQFGCSPSRFPEDYNEKTGDSKQ